jgi:hypothetical protein
MKKWTHELNREFSKVEVKMTKKYLKMCSTLLAIKEMQIRLGPVVHVCNPSYSGGRQSKRMKV